MHGLNGIGSELLGAADDGGTNLECAVELSMPGIDREDLEVLEFAVFEALSLPHEVRTTVAIRGTAPAAASLVGRQAVLDWRVGGISRRVHGIVENASREGERDGRAMLELVILHRVATLGRNLACRVFGKASLPEAIRRVMSENGLAEGTDFEIAFGESHPPRPHLVQYHESDLAFLARILREEGACFRLDPSRMGNPIVFIDGGSAMPVSEPSSIPLRPVGGGIGNGEHASHLSIRSAATAASVRLRDYGFEAPRDERTHRRSADGQGTDPERFEFIDAALESDVVQEKARRRLEAEVAQGPRLEGSTNLPTPVPGFVAGFADLPEAERAREQKHVFVEVVHRGESAGTYANHFEAASIEPAFRLATAGDGPRIRGIQTAWVAGPEGREGHPHCDEHGRVRLRFHWQDDFDLERAPWARVAQTLAGPGWGFTALPRVGNEVLVAFADGDPERPVVIGSLHNGVSVPPQKLPDHAARTTIRSRSLDGGSGHNEIVLDDTAGAERISIRAEKDREVLVQRDDRLEIKGGRTVRTTGKDLAEAAEIELSATRSITLRCGGSTIEITPSAISIDAPIVKLNS